MSEDHWITICAAPIEDITELLIFVNLEVQRVTLWTWREKDHVNISVIRLLA